LIEQRAGRAETGRVQPLKFNRLVYRGVGARLDSLLRCWSAAAAASSGRHALAPV